MFESLLGFAVLLLMGAGGFVLGPYLQAERVAAIGRWHTFAQRHGLQQSGTRAFGRVEGVEVEAQTIDRIGATQGECVGVRVRASIAPAFDLGLSLRAKGLLGGLERRLGAASSRVLTGDADVDSLYSVTAHEPERARQLFSTEVLTALRDAKLPRNLRVDDECVEFELVGELDVPHASWCLETALRLVAVLGRAALEVPPSRLTAPYLPAFEHAAEALGLRWLATPAALGGELDGVLVRALLTRRSAEVLGCRLEAAQTSSLGLGLELRPRGSGVLLRLGAKGLELGDVAFDRRFDLHASEPARVRDVFDEEVRERVARLADRGTLTVYDHGLVLELEGAPDPRDVVPSLRELRDLAETLAHRVHGQRAPRVAYR